MIEKRPFASLGHADHGWLNAHHHFSFAEYHDPERMHWGAIRVWNDDIIASGGGFPPHGHRDMEIVTYVRTGVVSHRDSLGNEGRTEAGDVQVMSAGKGIVHSEFNHEDGDTSLFQIWILPEAAGGEPGWGMRPFPKGDRSGRFVTLASGFPEDGDALPIRTRARVLGATLRIIAKARDIDFDKALATASSGRSGVDEAARGNLGYRVPLETSLDGNTVELSTEQSLFAENAIKYRTTLSFLEGRVGTIMSALRGE